MRYLALSILAALIVVSTIPLVLSYEFSDAEFTVPSWIKNNAGWWAEDKINDATFIGAIKYLINEGIMVVMEPEVVEETSTDIEEIVEMNGFDFIVNDHNCALCTNWGYTGTQYYFQIKTFDEHRGSPIDGVTINAKIISKGGELRHDFGALTTEDGIYNGNITIPGGTEWFGENILSVTAEYNGIEKTIENELEVFIQKRGGNECESENPFDLSGWETLPTGITFESGGSKMFVIGSTGDDVNEYTMNPRWCTSNAQFMDSFSVSGKETSPQSLEFSTDGTKMFILGMTDNDVTEYTLGTAWDVSTATYVDEMTDMGNNYEKPRAIDFSSDGTKMRILWSDKDVVGEYTCTTGFDVSTCSYSGDGERLQIQSQTVTPLGMVFNDDGTRLFIVSNTDNDVFEYACTAFDVGSCTVDSGDPFSVSSDDTAPSGIAFNTDGTKMFVLGDDGNDVNEYACSTGFDVSTCHGADDKDISGQEANALAMAFNSDGTKMFIGGFAGDDVNEYTLSTAYDVSTATFVDAFSILTHEGKITGLAFDTNGHRMFIVGQGGVEMNEYYLTVAWDVSTASHE